MEMVAPAGPVYQAGTLSGNPLAMTAGIETLEVLGGPGVYEQLDDIASRLEEGITDIAYLLNMRLTVSRFASLLTIFFTDKQVLDGGMVAQANTELFRRFFHQLLVAGIYWPPSQFEAAFVSLAHNEDDIEMTVSRIFTALSSLQRTCHIF
jgi:glutamate-1-semialdehyde 2,1-aminomutase